MRAKGARQITYLIVGHGARRHTTFLEWEAAAEQNLKRSRDGGAVAIKAKVRSADAVAFRIQAGLNVDPEALTATRIQATSRHHTSDH